LDVNGTASLNGTLDVIADGNYPLPLGSSFQVLQFTSESGQFTTLELPALNPGLSWDTSALYTTGTISIVPEPASLTGMSVAALALLRRRKNTHVQ
jgi:hypothetical protein